MQPSGYEPGQGKEVSKSLSVATEQALCRMELPFHSILELKTASLGKSLCTLPVLEDAEAATPAMTS